MSLRRHYNRHSTVWMETLFGVPNNRPNNLKQGHCRDLPPQAVVGIASVNKQPKQPPNSIARNSVALQQTHFEQNLSGQIQSQIIGFKNVGDSFMFLPMML